MDDSAASINMKLKPKRVAIFLTAIEMPNDGLEEVLLAVVDDAESRGLFFEWGTIADMGINDVIPGSPLHKALNGQPPDR